MLVLLKINDAIGQSLATERAQDIQYTDQHISQCCIKLDDPLRIGRRAG